MAPTGRDGSKGDLSGAGAWPHRVEGGVTGGGRSGVEAGGDDGTEVGRGILQRDLDAAEAEAVEATAAKFLGSGEP